MRSIWGRLRRWFDLPAGVLGLAMVTAGAVVVVASEDWFVESLGVGIVAGGGAMVGAALVLPLAREQHQLMRWVRGELARNQEALRLAGEALDAGENTVTVPADLFQDTLDELEKRKAPLERLNDAAQRYQHLVDAAGKLAVPLAVALLTGAVAIAVALID